tara:strand:- start:358 stop:549 length:192 start_codon:yes stop_codon:yes gene_type:complete
MRILIILLLLTGCTAYKDGSSMRAWDPTSTVISQFFKALATGDTSDIKVSKKDDEKEWEKIDE